MKIAICLAILVAYVVSENCRHSGPVHTHNHHNGTECNHTVCVHNYTKVCHHHECSCIAPHHHNHTANHTAMPCKAKSDCGLSFCKHHVGGHMNHCFDNWCVCMQQ